MYECILSGIVQP